MSAFVFIAGVIGRRRRYCEALLGVVVAVVVGGGTGVVVVVVGVGGGAENGGSIANRMSANTNAATIAAIHHLRRGVSGSSRAPAGV